MKVRLITLSLLLFTIIITGCEALNNPSPNTDPATTPTPESSPSPTAP